MRVQISTPVWTSHSLAVVSMLPVATTVLCGLNWRHTCKQKENVYQGSTLSIAQVKLEMGQIVSDTYPPEGQVEFLEKVSNISSLIREVLGQAGTF